MTNEVDFKHTVAIRLRQYAEGRQKIYDALERLADMDIADDDQALSDFTPSRNQCSKQLDQLLGTVHGYCIAADDFLGRSHGTTEKRWYGAVRKRLMDPPIDMQDAAAEADNDSGYNAAHDDAMAAAEEAFGEYIFGDD